MVKQELIKTLEKIRIAQTVQNKFLEYYTDFTSEPRCKKGCLEFLDSLQDYDSNAKPYLFQRERRDIAIGFTATKSEHNSSRIRRMMSQCSLRSDNAVFLVQTRARLLVQVGEYITWIHEELEKSPLRDAKERQVYLRRAIGRLASVLQTELVVPITKDQWCKVEVRTHFDYLNRSLPELVNTFSYPEGDMYGGVWYDWWNLDRPNTLDSVASYLDYLDSFLVY